MDPRPWLPNSAAVRTHYSILVNATDKVRKRYHSKCASRILFEQRTENGSKFEQGKGSESKYVYEREGSIINGTRCMHKR